MPESVDLDPDPDQAKKTQIYRSDSEVLIMRGNLVYNKIRFFKHVGEGRRTRGKRKNVILSNTSKQVLQKN